MPTRFPAPSGAGVMSMRALTRGPSATIAAGTTTTGAEGTSAAVSNSGSSTAATFDFTIPRGAIPAVGFNFDTSTTDADPGAGDVRFNHATPASVTEIYFDNADRDGNTVTSWLDTFDDSTSTNNGVLTFTPAATPSAKLVYSVTGSVVDGTGYRKVTVTHVAGTTLPSSGAHLGVTFSRTGDKGDTGADAVIPATAFNFNTATTDSDKDAGDIWFNNATPASVTVIYFDNADRDANTVTSWLDAFDDSTSTVKGTLTLIPAASTANKLIYNVTGSVTDGTGYRKVAVTHVAGTTLPSNDANIAVSFSRTGNDGVDGEMAGPGVSVDGEIALYDGIGGATLKRASTTGVLKASSGVLAAAVSGTDYCAATSGSSVLKGSSGNTTAAVDGTDYLSPSTGIAQGKHTIWIPASAMLSATTSGPAGAQFETSTNDINFKVLDFDATADEHAHFNVAFPNSWNEGTVTFQVFWMSSATDTDGVAWGLQGVAISDNEATDASWGTAVVVTDDAQSAASELYVTSESSAVTIGGTPAAGDVCFFRIFRDVSDANDDMTEDARLIGVKIFYTINASTDA
jgi:hypothetical protein